MSEPELRAGWREAPPPIVGESLALRRVTHLAQRFAPRAKATLILGATGTGKELLAEHIHAWSGRAGDLVDINCAALPRELVESLLFGQRRGVFTGAVETVPGLIEAADAGTLFLDEVDSLTLEGQAKLLRVLENHEVRRLGESGKRRVDFRIVAAARGPLGPAMAAGAFRPDLYQRLAGVVLILPPLADRGEDVVLLARHFADSHGALLAAEAEPVLRAYPWPGNVRELAASIERATCLDPTGPLGPETLREAIALGAPGAVPPVTEAHGAPTVETEALRAVLDVCEAHAWDARATAAALGIGRTTLYLRLRAAGISLRRRKQLFRNVQNNAEQS